MGDQYASSPFDAGRFLCFPDRKMCGFLIEAENRPGVSGKMSTIPGKHNASIHRQEDPWQLLISVRSYNQYLKLTTFWYSPMFSIEYGIGETLTVFGEN